MDKRPYDEPAFPVHGIHGEHPGMSLRDWFAGQALAAFLSSDESQRQLAAAVAQKHSDGDDQRRVMNDVLAKRSYWLADAMLEAREKQQ